MGGLTTNHIIRFIKILIFPDAQKHLNTKYTKHTKRCILRFRVLRVFRVLQTHLCMPHNSFVE
jgi:hypothetical protein